MPAMSKLARAQPSQTLQHSPSHARGALSTIPSLGGATPAAADAGGDMEMSFGSKPPRQKLAPDGASANKDFRTSQQGFGAKKDRKDFRTTAEGFGAKKDF